MEIKSNITLSEAEIKTFGTTLDEVQENLTLPNPAYNNIRRFGKSKFSYRYSSVPKELVYLRKVKGTDLYVLPRYYFSGDVKSGVVGRQLDCSFLKDLRDYQKDFINKNIDDIKANTSLLLEAACGSGKTVMAIYLSCLRGRQSLILVPTYYLARQWENAIHNFTDATVTVLSTKDTDIKVDNDFTILVMDLFNVRTLPKELNNNIGTVILDEAHRVGADTYLPILDSIPAQYRIALTATFRREDGVHKILAYHFGLHLKMESRFPKPSIYTIGTNIKIKYIVSKNKPFEDFLNILDYHHIDYMETEGAIVPSEFSTTLGKTCYRPSTLLKSVESLLEVGKINKTQYKNIKNCISRSEELSYPTIDSFLAENSKRRKTVIKLIKECLEAGRTVLFLSKRKNVLKSLTNYFKEYKPMLIISETNSRSPEEEEYLQNDCRLIFGVTQLAKEGLDIDRLDTLIIHLPMKDTEQAIGRIARLHPKKKSPMAFYLLDSCPITFAVFNNAKKFMSINGELKGNTSLSTLKDLPNF